MAAAITESGPAGDDEFGAIVGELFLGALESYDTGDEALLIAIDDADLLPRSCVSVLGYIARRLARLRVFLILTTGPHIDSRLSSLPQLPMYTLTAEESASFVASVSGRRPPLSTLVELHAVSHGNPAHLRELSENLTIAQLEGHAALPSPTAVGERRMDHWRLTLENLTAVQRTALTILTITGSLEPNLLAEALLSGPEPHRDPEGEIAALVNAGVLRAIRHEVQAPNNLDRAAIYLIAPPDLRKECHRIIEAHSLLRYLPTRAMANPVFAADELVQSVDEIIRCTRELARTGEVGLAIHTLRRASELTTDAKRAELAAQGQLIALEYGYLTDSAGFAGFAESEHLAPADAAKVVSVQLLLRHLQDEPLDSEGVLRIVESLAARCPRSASTLAATAAYFHAYRYELDEARRVLAVTEPAGGYCETSQLRTVLAYAHLAIAEDDVERASQALSDAGGTEQHEGPVESLMSAHLLQQLGRHAESAVRLDHISAQTLTPIERLVLLTLQVDNEIFAGNIDTAHRLWNEAYAVVPVENCLPSLRVCQRMHILGLMGRFDDADALVEKIRSTPARHAQLFNESRLLWVLGQIALMKCDVDSAISLLTQSIDTVDSVSGHWQLHRHVDLVEAFTIAGQQDAADNVLQALVDRLPVRPSPSAKAAVARGQLLLAASPDQARSAFSRALGARSEPAPVVERARAHAIYAEQWHDDSTPVTYQRHRRSAHALLTRIGAVGWIEGAGWTGSGPADLMPASARRPHPHSASTQQATTAFTESASDLAGAEEPATSIYRQALEVIDATFTDRELNPRVLAGRLGISVRTAHRVFHRHGTSISREIRKRRVERAENLLRQPRYSHLTLSEIAAISGAPSVAYLRTGIKEKHDLSPSELRELWAAETVEDEAVLQVLDRE